ncbi:MAG: hypothetical protein ACRC7N_14915 [Clostridium sp.]
MKCRYADCKLGKVVSKEEAIKDGSAYYHKECLREKQLKAKIEEYYLENMPSTTLMLLRKVIKQLLTEKGYSAEYILHVCKWIVANKKPIKVPFGLINYCTNEYVFQEWNEKKISEEYNKIKDNVNKIESYDKPSFRYKPTNKKKFTDII